MLPTLSRLSVSQVPEGRLRHRPSSRYLRISPLHLEFHLPLTDSSNAVSRATLQLSCSIPPQTYTTAYAPFKPSNSEQRSPPLSYRGCWHRVSRGLFARYHHHCPRQKEFTTRRPSSSTRRRCIRVSPIVQYSPLLPPVGVWTVSQFQCGRSTSQSGYPSQAWWSHYLTNYLIGRRPIPQRINPFPTNIPARGLMRY